LDRSGPGEIRRVLEEVIAGGPPGEEAYDLENLGRYEAGSGAGRRALVRGRRLASGPGGAPDRFLTAGFEGLHTSGARCRRFRRHAVPARGPVQFPRLVERLDRLLARAIEDRRQIQAGDTVITAVCEQDSIRQSGIDGIGRDLGVARLTA
jgi:hypothetical protein